jgi:hypothetical protein
MPENYAFLDETPGNSTATMKALLGMTQTYLDMAKNEPNGTLDPKIIDKALDDFHNSLKYRLEPQGLTFWRIFTRGISFIGLIILIVVAVYLRSYCNFRRQLHRERQAEVFEPIQMVRRPPRRRDTPSPAAV